MQKLIAILFIFSALFGLAFALNENNTSLEQVPICFEQSSERISLPPICGCPESAEARTNGENYTLKRTSRDCFEVMEHGGDYCMGTCAYEGRLRNGTIITRIADCGYGME